MPYGYYTQSGYMGRIQSGQWILFATMADYLEHLEESEK